MCMLSLNKYILNASLITNVLKGRTRVPLVEIKQLNHFSGVCKSFHNYCLQRESGGLEWEQTSSPVDVQNWSINAVSECVK